MLPKYTGKRILNMELKRENFVNVASCSCFWKVEGKEVFLAF